MNPTPQSEKSNNNTGKQTNLAGTVVEKSEKFGRHSKNVTCELCRGCSVTGTRNTRLFLGAHTHITEHRGRDRGGEKGL